MAGRFFSRVKNGSGLGFHALRRLLLRCLMLTQESAGAILAADGQQSTLTPNDLAAVALFAVVDGSLSIQDGLPLATQNRSLRREAVG